MHYEALPPESALSRAMLQFTRVFAAKSGDDFTGHLSFDFLMDEVVTERVGVSRAVSSFSRLLLACQRMSRDRFAQKHVL